MNIKSLEINYFYSFILNNEYVKTDEVLIDISSQYKHTYYINTQLYTKLFKNNRTK